MGIYQTKIKEGIQKVKNFYLNKVDTTFKKFSFWMIVVAVFLFFVFILPLFLGCVLAYIFCKFFLKGDMFEKDWSAVDIIKYGFLIFILIMTFSTQANWVSVQTDWTQDFLGMNTPPDLIITNPKTEMVELKGIYTIYIEGNVKPEGSIIKIDNNIIQVAEDGNFSKNISLNKKDNEIKIIGEHGSGITEKIITIYRVLTDEEIAEEKRLEEEQKARDEQKRIAREEIRKKAEEYNKINAQKILFPVKELINKTPAEIESLTGAKVIDYGKNTSGTLMNASIDFQGLSIDTAYILVEHLKVKYNGVIFFNIHFDNPVNENDAWKIVGLSKPDKKQTYTRSTNYSSFTWRNISPFFEVQASHPYKGNTLIIDESKIEFIECYLLTENEDMELY